MTSLYKISSEYQSLFSEINNEEEVTNNSLLILDSYQSKVEDKAIAIGCFIKNLESEQLAIDMAIKNMTQRKKNLDNKISYIKDYLKINMEKCGILEISSSPYFKIKLKVCPISVNITDEDKIPDEYKKYKEVISIDKIKLKEDLKQGLYVNGAELHQNLRLEIK